MNQLGEFSIKMAIFQLFSKQINTQFINICIFILDGGTALKRF